MAVIADKAWYKSKTIWTSVIAGVVGSFTGSRCCRPST